MSIFWIYSQNTFFPLNSYISCLYLRCFNDICFVLFMVSTIILFIPNSCSGILILLGQRSSAKVEKVKCQFIVGIHWKLSCSIKNYLYTDFRSTEWINEILCNNRSSPYIEIIQYDHFSEFVIPFITTKITNETYDNLEENNWIYSQTST